MKTFDKIAKWIAVDGLLHFLVCYAIMLTLAPFIGIGWSAFSTVVIAVVKEVYDIMVKDATDDMVTHDLICDVCGIVMAVGVILCNS